MLESAQSEAASQQLVTYTFPPGADFGGLLVGALQRIESGGAIRILDALFVARGARAGEVVAISRHNDTSVGMIGQLIGFQRAPAALSEETDNALNGPAGDTIREIAAALEPGCAFAALLVEHSWANVLEQTVAQIGGSRAGSELLTPAEAEHVWAELPRELARSAG